MNTWAWAMKLERDGMFLKTIIHQSKHIAIFSSDHLRKGN
jgi:hypothetical protein